MIVRGGRVVDVEPVLGENITWCFCPFNVSFTVLDLEPNVFYLKCWWFEGLAELTEGEPLVLEDVRENGVNYTLWKAGSTPSELFDLQGRRVIGEPTRGIYIQNGKKRVVK